MVQHSISIYQIYMYQYISHKHQDVKLGVFKNSSCKFHNSSPHFGCRGYLAIKLVQMSCLIQAYQLCSLSPLTTPSICIWRFCSTGVQNFIRFNNATKGIAMMKERLYLSSYSQGKREYEQCGPHGGPNQSEASCSRRRRSPSC